MNAVTRLKEIEKLLLKDDNILLDIVACQWIKRDCLKAEKRGILLGMEEVQKSDEMILDLLEQACQIINPTGKFIDNQCLSTYEDACNYLETKGLLVNRNGRLYDYPNKGKQ